MASSTQAETGEGTFFHDVVAGLALPKKQLDSKYFYDERGSRLFDRICELDEYYLTRTELSIMRAHAAEMAEEIGPHARLVEFGSGSSVKTRWLIDHLPQPAGYVPVDVSEEHLNATVDTLREDYPKIEIQPVVADFTQPFSLPEFAARCEHTTVYFPGSTIGNFSQKAAAALMEGISHLVGKEGGLLIGIDLEKETRVIEAAYNDAEGVTSEFTLNVLRRANDELDANFDLEQFSHKAVYNSEKARIETYIVSDRDQEVQVGDHAFDFTEGEHMITEYSHKYTVEGFCQFAGNYGFARRSVWTDPENLFAVLHLVIE